MSRGPLSRHELPNTVTTGKPIVLILCLQMLCTDDAILKGTFTADNSSFSQSTCNGWTGLCVACSCVQVQLMAQPPLEHYGWADFQVQHC